VGKGILFYQRTNKHFGHDKEKKEGMKTLFLIILIPKELFFLILNIRMVSFFHMHINIYTTILEYKWNEENGFFTHISLAHPNKKIQKFPSFFFYNIKIYNFGCWRKAYDEL
jgi:hypothetical protein